MFSLVSWEKQSRIAPSKWISSHEYMNAVYKIHKHMNAQNVWVCQKLHCSYTWDLKNVNRI